MQEPNAAIRAFMAAVAGRDDVRARQLCTRTGWGTGDTAFRLFKQGTSESLDLHEIEPARVLRDRAVGHLALWWPRYDRYAGTVWVLLVRVDGDWYLEGVHPERAFAALFLDGALPAVLSAKDLPESPDGIAWAEAEMARMRAGVVRSGTDVHDVWPAPILARLPTADDLDVEGLARQIAMMRAAPIVALTSSRSREGKSAVALALARHLVSKGQRVLLVDADLHLPRIYRRLNLAPAPGLCEAAEGDPPLIQHAEGIDVLAAGFAAVPAVPTLEESGAVLAELAARYDRVIVDCAPCLEFDDLFALRSGVDLDVLVVVQIARALGDELAQVRSRLADAGLEPLGLVLTRVDEVEVSQEVSLIGTRALDPVGRVAVGLRLHRPDGSHRDRWSLLQRDEEGVLRLLRHEAALTWGGLLDGVGVPELAQVRSDPTGPALQSAVEWVVRELLVPAARSQR